MSATIAIADKFHSIVGDGNFHAAAISDSVLGRQVEYVVSPANEKELAAVLACANEAGVAVIPRGNGTKMEWGNPPQRAEIILSTLRLNRVLEHAWADLTLTVEAGCTLQTVQTELAQHRQRLALDTLWPEWATVGGVLSSNDNGTLRLRFGALRDLIIGVTLALPDGTLASSGGKVVKNVAGYDLPKLATGALGTLGVITRAVFRLHPLCGDSLTLTFGASNIEEMQERILALQDSQLAHTSLQIRCGSEAGPEADILFEATPAGLLAQQAQLQNLLGTSGARKSSEQNWLAKQQLWQSSDTNCAVAKLSVLPNDIAKTVRTVEQTTGAQGLAWKLVMQATGIGWLRFNGAAPSLRSALERLRAQLEGGGGSLVLLRRPADMESLDVWGNPGDAISVMRALKHQLDPKNTLNPGRFVGGI
jgi:glycolate oxidase FAD binding subunit